MTLMRDAFVNSTLTLVEQGLRDIGYTDGLLRWDYTFADLLGRSDAIRRVPLAAFGQEPPSYRSACFGVLVSDGRVDLASYRALGAPQLLEIDQGEIRRWKVTANGAPEILQRITPDDILDTIRRHRGDWRPESILRAKSIAFAPDPIQLDFFDAGLLPAIEAVVHTKLDRLLRDTLAASRAAHQEGNLSTLDYPKLFRLVFRLLAAKLFADRGHPGEWMQNDPAAVISAVEQFYYRRGAAEPVLDDPNVQHVAWSKIRSAFHLQNISVEALAYVYENTLVDEGMRRQFGIHSTPRELAEYIVHRLPFEDLPLNDRRVFEPFAGHAAFLIAALGKLRTLLPASLESAQRHEYFVRMLTGMEIDSFACEVARLSLMLADYPNPDGWRLLEGDIFGSPMLDGELSTARVVLCNPPFENFTRDERTRYTGLRSVNKAAHILLRVLEDAPDFLGFVLPRPFIDGKFYREAQRKLAGTYGNMEIVALPDSAFQHAGMETVLLIARDLGRSLTYRRSAEVAKHDYNRFIQTGKPSREFADTRVDKESTASADPPILWMPPLERVWRALDGLPALGDVADVRNGIYFRLPLRKASEHLVSKQPRPGFRPGLVRVSDGFEPLVIREYVYLNVDTDVMYPRSKAHLFPWDQPKVIVNRARLGAGPWVVAGAPDYKGLVVYHLFHAMWPTERVSLEVLAAIVSGPVANAFMSVHRTSRDNRIETLKRVPIPSFRPEHTSAISAAVMEYQRARVEWLRDASLDETMTERCRQALLRIDAELLSAYDLPPKVERELLDYFAAYRRPGPVEFDRYYPEDFRPALPLRMFVSGQRQRASAEQTLKRLPVLRDPAITEMVAELD